MSQVVVILFTTITIILFCQSGRAIPQQPVSNYQQPYFIQPYYYNGYQQPIPYQPGFGQNQPFHLGAYQFNGAIGLPPPPPPPPQNQHQQIDDPYPNIKAEIIDVDPEYQRQLLGPVQAFNQAPSSNPSGGVTYQHHYQRRPPQYIVKTNSYATNYTNIPVQQPKPQITRNSYSTVINRHFVYDPSRPAQKPINLSFINGVPVTESSITQQAPEVTTRDQDDEAISSTTSSNNADDVDTTTVNNAEENDQPEDQAFQLTTTEQSTNGRNLSGRRFVDVPKYCPDGTQVAHNGLCLEPFRLPLKFNSNVENPTITTTESDREQQEPE